MQNDSSMDQNKETGMAQHLKTCKEGMQHTLTKDMQQQSMANLKAKKQGKEGTVGCWTLATAASNVGCTKLCVQQSDEPSSQEQRPNRSETSNNLASKQV